MKQWLWFLAVTVMAACPALTFAQANAAATADGWIDISAPIDPRTTPVYPGDAPIKFDFLKRFDAGDKLTLSAYSMGAHTATHVDAPLHFIKGGAPLNQIPLERFMGPVRVIDCSAEALAIDATELNKHPWRGAKRIFFRTRNSRKGWMTDPTFHKDFTYVAPDAARLLADAGVELVGIDYISMEQFGAPEPRTHQALLGRNIPIIEGLLLSDVQPGDYDLILLPIRVIGHEAAPVRALLKRR
ncbi:MAG: cyclase family protein [Gammaproteobacteria bacterium]